MSSSCSQRKDSALLVLHSGCVLCGELNEIEPNSIERSRLSLCVWTRKVRKGRTHTNRVDWYTLSFRRKLFVQNPEFWIRTSDSKQRKQTTELWYCLIDSVCYTEWFAKREFSSYLVFNLQSSSFFLLENEKIYRSSLTGKLSIELIRKELSKFRFSFTKRRFDQNRLA